MNIQWPAVIAGWLADTSLSTLVRVLALWIGASTFFRQPDPGQFSNLLLLALLLFAALAGGYVAGAVAGVSPIVNGLMVGVLGIISGFFLNLGHAGIAPLLLIEQLAGCALAALGGLVSSFHHDKTNYTE
jgi:hypothetical protein